MLFATWLVVLMIPEPPPISEGEELLKRATAILQTHQKYQTIELLWSKDTAQFSVGRRR